MCLRANLGRGPPKCPADDAPDQRVDLLNPEAADYEAMISRSNILECDLRAYLFARKATLLFALRKPHEALRMGLEYIRRTISCSSDSVAWSAWAAHAALELTGAVCYSAMFGQKDISTADPAYVAHLAQATLLSVENLIAYERCCAQLLALALESLERVWRTGDQVAHEFEHRHLAYKPVEFMRKVLTKECAPATNSVPFSSACRIFFYRSMREHYQKGKRARFAVRYAIAHALELMGAGDYKTARTILEESCIAWDAGRISGRSDTRIRDEGTSLDDWPHLHYHVKLIIARCSFVLGKSTGSLWTFFRDLLSLLSPDLLWSIPESWRVATQRAFATSLPLATGLHAYSLEALRFFEIQFTPAAEGGAVELRMYSWLPLSLSVDEIGVEFACEKDGSLASATHSELDVSPGHNVISFGDLNLDGIGKCACQMLWVRCGDVMLTSTDGVKSSRFKYCVLDLIS